MRSFEEYWNEHGDVYAMEIAEDAWDYQQSKIDELQKRIDGIKKIICEAYESNGNSSVEIVFDEIEHLEQALKGNN